MLKRYLSYIDYMLANYRSESPIPKKVYFGNGFCITAGKSGYKVEYITKGSYMVNFMVFCGASILDLL